MLSRFIWSCWIWYERASKGEPVSHISSRGSFEERQPRRVSVYCVLHVRLPGYTAFHINYPNTPATFFSPSWDKGLTRRLPWRTCDRRAESNAQLWFLSSFALLASKFGLIKDLSLTSCCANRSCSGEQLNINSRWAGLRLKRLFLDSYTMYTWSETFSTAWTPVILQWQCRDNAINVRTLQWYAFILKSRLLNNLNKCGSDSGRTTVRELRNVICYVFEQI